MGKGHRQGRLGEEIRRIISEMILREVKDPRITDVMVSISGVDVTSDGSYATCYVSILAPSSSEEEKRACEEDVIAGLKSAKGLFKKEIGRKIKLRHIPELIFKIDTAMEYGRHISEVIEKLGISDEE